MTSELQSELAASAAAAAAGNIDAADRHWRTYIGMLELKMGRTGSVERLTPEIKHEQHPGSTQAVSGEKPRQPAMASGSVSHDGAAGSPASSEVPGAGNLIPGGAR